jgi:uncharacterized protein YbjT (DUF2867 family)
MTEAGGLRVLLIGATGVVGTEVLRLALDEPRFAAIVAPTRRPLPPHPKLTNPLVDFGKLRATDPWWSVDGVVATLGTTQRTAGSPEAFRAVDHGYTLAVARLAHAAGATRFALTSSLGADPASRSFYLRTKGEIERDVEAIGFPSLTIVRPGLLGGARSERRLAEDIGKVVLGFLGPVVPARWRVCPPERVAAALVAAIVAGRPERHIIPSEQLV